MQGGAGLGDVPSARTFRTDEGSGCTRARGKVETGVTVTLCRG